MFQGKGLPLMKMISFFASCSLGDCPSGGIVFSFPIFQEYLDLFNNRNVGSYAAYFLIYCIDKELVRPFIRNGKFFPVHP